MDSAYRQFLERNQPEGLSPREALRGLDELTDGRRGRTARPRAPAMERHLSYSDEFFGRRSRAHAGVIAQAGALVHVAEPVVLDESRWLPHGSRK